MRLTFANPAEQLEYELQKLMEQSKEQLFTDYLKTIRESGRQHPENAEQLRGEVIRKYLIYQRRQLESGNTVAPFSQVIYGNMEAPIVLEKAAPAAPQEKPVWHPETPAPQQEKPVWHPEESAARPVRYYEEPSKKKDSVEFAVGGIVLSVLGVIFILAAGISLATHFMTAFYQGVMLYACCIIIFLFSELLVSKRLPKLSYTLTAMAFSGAFLTTVINHFYLARFDLWLTVLVLVGLSVATCFFAWKKKSEMYSIVGFVAAFLCSSILGPGLAVSEYLILMGLTLLLNLMWILFPIKKESDVFSCIQLGCNAIFMTFASNLTLLSDVRGISESSAQDVFLAVSWIVYVIIFLVATFRTGRRHARKNSNVSAVGICYLSFSLLYAITYSVHGIHYDYADKMTLTAFVVLGSFGLASITAFLMLQAKKDRRWSYAYMVSLLMVLCASAFVGSEIASDIVFVIVLIASCIVCKVHSSDVLVKTTNLVLAAFMIFYLFSFDMDESDYEFALAAILLIASTVVLALRTGYVTAVQCIMTVCIAALPSVYIPDLFDLTIALGLTFALSLAVNYIPYFRDVHFRGYNWFTLVWGIFMLLTLNSSKYDDYLFVLAINLVLGLGIFISLASKHYQMPFAGKHLIVSCYLTYAVLVLRIPSNIATSIMLMVIAFISVGIGFGFHQKAVRVYGLVLALFVCAKLVFYDFFDVDLFQRTILYFVIGIIALAIATVYLVLEKKMKKEEEAIAVAATPTVSAETAKDVFTRGE